MKRRQLLPNENVGCSGDCLPENTSIVVIHGRDDRCDGFSQHTAVFLKELVDLVAACSRKLDLLT